MTDWATISSLATAGGTLVLAAATFGSVRSANRSTKLSELALQEQLRPMLVHSHLDDPVQQIRFGDDHRVKTGGGRGTIEEGEGNIYLTLSLRNVGSGIAVLQAWRPSPEEGDTHVRPEPATFRAQQRDFYIPPGGVGLWQGALRDPDEEVYSPMAAVCREQRPFRLDLLYSDNVGAQRTISRFLVSPWGDGIWTGEVVRNWHLDRRGAR